MSAILRVLKGLLLSCGKAPRAGQLRIVGQARRTAACFASRKNTSENRREVWRKDQAGEVATWKAAGFRVLKNPRSACGPHQAVAGQNGATRFKAYLSQVLQVVRSRTQNPQ